MKYRVILREFLHQQLADHLLSGMKCGGTQEEVCLALWRRAEGFNYHTGILGELFLPQDDDRDLHGNVTLNSEYLNRVLDHAVQLKSGIAVLHSHPSSGWQNLSNTDDNTERNIITPYIRETGLPLLGLTLSIDSTWSARFWSESTPGQITLAHCMEVRRVGTRHTKADWHPDAYPPYTRRLNLIRTIDCWGIEAQEKLARTHVCVVGAGSVGSIVLECLARIGFEEITVIDPDLIEYKNLDRLIYADRHCIGLYKTEVASSHLHRIATAENPIIRSVPLSIRTERGYRLAADSDIIISCVDNAEARDVLNHLAYSNCLPLIDGGVLVESNERLLSAKWQAHLVGPNMQCLRCRGQYTTSDARDERMGIRRQGHYIKDDVKTKSEPGQNTIAFCSIVAAEQIRMLVRYLVGSDWWHDDTSTSGQWSFEHRFVETETEMFEHPGQCVNTCEFAHHRLGRGIDGRPKYPFAEIPKNDWTARVKYRCRKAQRKIQRTIATLTN